MGFQKFMPQVIFYRIYKIFGNGKFQVNRKICRFDKNDINNFKGQSFQYAPIIKKYIQANEAPFMTKNLHKEIMKRSRLRSKNLKFKSLTDRKTTVYNIIIARSF